MTSTANQHQPKAASTRPAADSCALCQRQAQLARSHILPAFAFRWVKETSVTPYLRASNAPNRRVQDGSTMPLLCNDCEGLISDYEGAFAKKVFRPFHNNSSISVPYEDWLLRFCVSVSWRVLAAAMKNVATARPPHFPTHEPQIRLALDRWRRFLLGSETTIAPFDQHLLLLPKVTQVGGKWPPTLNRFFLRHIGMDVPMGEINAVTYAKLPGFMLFGAISTPTSAWQGTQVLPRGLLEPQRYGLPGFLADYIAEKSDTSWLGQVSVRQQRKTDEEIIKNQHQWKSSATHEALRSDLELFGERALDSFSDSSEPEEE